MHETNPKQVTYRQRLDRARIAILNRIEDTASRAPGEHLAGVRHLAEALRFLEPDKASFGPSDPPEVQGDEGLFGDELARVLLDAKAVALEAVHADGGCHLPKWDALDPAERPKWQAFAAELSFRYRVVRRAEHDPAPLLVPPQDGVIVSLPLGRVCEAMADAYMPVAFFELITQKRPDGEVVGTFIRSTNFASARFVMQVRELGFDRAIEQWKADADRLRREAAKPAGGASFVPSDPPEVTTTATIRLDGEALARAVEQQPTPEAMSATTGWRGW